MATVFEIQPVVQYDTVNFVLHARKNGVPWDITGGSVYLFLKKPDGTLLGPFSAIIIDPINGVANYQVDNSVIITTGDWSKQWRIVAGATSMRSKPKIFPVYPAYIGDGD